MAQVRGVLAEQVVFSSALDPFLSLRALANYSCVSVRKLLEILTELPDAHARVVSQRPKRQKRVQGTAEDDLLGQDASDLSHGLTRADGLAPSPRWLSSVLRLAQPTALGVHASRLLASGSRSVCGPEPSPAGLLGVQRSAAPGLDDYGDLLKGLE